MDRPGLELLAPFVRHPDDGGVDVEHLDDGPREGLQSLVEPEALRERARDLVQRAQPPRRRPFGGERRLALLPEARRLLVQLRVLDGYRKLPRERRQQRRFVLARRGPPGRVGSEEPDDLAARHERNGQRRSDAGLPSGGLRNRKSPIAHDIGDL